MKKTIRYMVGIIACIVISMFYWVPRHINADTIQIRPELLTGVTTNPIVISADGLGNGTLNTQNFEDGSVLIYGQTYASTYGTYVGNGDAYIAKMNSTGQTVWSRQIGSTGDDTILDARILTNGNVLISGRTNGSIWGNSGTDDTSALLLLDSSGNTIWTTKIPYEGYSSCGIVDINTDGSSLVSVSSETGHKYLYVSSTGTIMWQYDASSWPDSSIKYIGRHGTHYSFACEIYDQTETYQNTEIRCIEAGQLVADSITITNFLTDGMYLTNGTRMLMGTSYVSSTDLGVSIANPVTGVRTLIQSLPYINHRLTTEVVSVDGSKLTYLLRKESYCGGEGTDDPDNDWYDQSETVYQYANSQVVKLFDVYYPQASPGITAQVKMRSDGSFISVACWGDGGYGNETGIGTVIGLYGSDGTRVGEYSTLMNAQIAWANKSDILLAGYNSVGEYGNRVEGFCATLSVVAAPTFSLAPGNYTGTQSVSISCATTGATIRYTTDGREPTEASTQYTAPLLISTNTTVKARGFKAATLPSLRSDAAYKLRRATASKQSK